MGVQGIWAVLKDVPDPEIPAVSVLDLGIVRSVEEDKVIITPTYSGCPATHFIEQSIREALDAAGFRDVAIETRLAAGMDHRLDQRGGQGQAPRLRHRPARPRQDRDLPAMRIDRYRGSQPLRFNPVQGAMALPPAWSRSTASNATDHSDEAAGFAAFDPLRTVSG